MKSYTTKELQVILSNHLAFLNDYSKIELKADLSGANLRGAYLRGANLSDSYLRGVDLRGADLSDSYLRGVDLSDANLRNANLRNADLRGADLRNADFSDADLRNADFSDAYLSDANLSRADFSDADLRGADISRADLRGAKLPNFQLCPQKFTFTAYKKVKNQIILTLEVIGDRTSSLVGRKCRASKVRVLKAEDCNGNPVSQTTFESEYKSDFVYTLGEIKEEPNYNSDIRLECVKGIHFFITKQEAIDY